MAQKAKRSKRPTPVIAARLPGPAAARYLGWSPQTLANKRSLVRKGTLSASAVPPVHQATGASTYYLVADLDAWLEAQGGA